MDLFNHVKYLTWSLTAFKFDVEIAWSNLVRQYRNKRIEFKIHINSFEKILLILQPWLECIVNRTAK